MSEASARPAPQPEEVFAVLNEAIDRLSLARRALAGFLDLLNGYDNMGALRAERLSCLIAPHVAEVDAALDELHSIHVLPTTH